MPFVKENVITSVRKRTVATGVEFSRRSRCDTSGIHRTRSRISGQLTLLPFFPELRLETNFNRFASYLGAGPPSLLPSRPLALDQAIFQQQHDSVWALPAAPAAGVTPNPNATYPMMPRDPVFHLQCQQALPFLHPADSSASKVFLELRPSCSGAAQIMGRPTTEPHHWPSATITSLM